jgi:hypothetical protein
LTEIHRFGEVYQSEPPHNPKGEAWWGNARNSTGFQILRILSLNSEMQGWGFMYYQHTFVFWTTRIHTANVGHPSTAWHESLVFAGGQLSVT